MPPDERLCVMPEVYGQELQPWNARRVFGKILRDLPREYIDRRLRTKEVSFLLKRDTSTIRQLCIEGKLKHGIDKKGRTYSIKDLSDFLVENETRKFSSENHGKWSDDEKKELIKNGYCIGRSKSANKIMLSRLRNAKFKDENA